MDAIRLRQIREALDYDKRMYAAASELEKRRLAKMDERPDDQTAANQGSLESVGEALAELKENRGAGHCPAQFQLRLQDQRRKRQHPGGR